MVGVEIQGEEGLDGVEEGDWGEEELNGVGWGFGVRVRELGIYESLEVREVIKA